MPENSPLVPYRISICGLNELCLHSSAGITHVLTILDPEHPDPEVFATYGGHSRLVWRFHDTIGDREDMAHPTEAVIQAILEFGTTSRDLAVDHLLVHCHMGISRSTACAAILMAQSNPGREREVFAHIRAIRPVSWPNSRMIALADGLLDRAGALVEAMREHHALVARAHPEFVALLRQGERACEIPDGHGL